MYVSDTGKIKGMPLNSRASEICGLAGKPTSVYGDCFIARIFDDNADDFRRLDFKLNELSSDAEWIKKAALLAKTQPPRSMEELQEFLNRQKQQSKSNAPTSTNCANPACGQPASLRCARCKKVAKAF